MARLRRQVNDLMAKHQAAAAEVRRLQGEQESSEVLQEKVSGGVVVCMCLCVCWEPWVASM